MGGTWERMIGSVHTVLKTLAKKQVLTDEQLQTLLSESEKIIKYRSITTVSGDPNDPPALTPRMLLLMKSNPSFPPGVFVKEDICAKRRWKQVQYLASVFRRWAREYLPALQARQKRMRSKTNIPKEDIVLVAERNIQKGQWPLGRVIDTNMGRD